MSEMERGKASVRMSAQLIGANRVAARALAGGTWPLECWRLGPDGKRYLAWRDTIHNRIVNSGLIALLESTLLSGAQIGSWYVGLMSTGASPASGDSLASHAGWTDLASTVHTAQNRPQWVGVRSGLTADNNASQAQFTFATNTGVGGAYLCSHASSVAATETLYAAGALGTTRQVVTGDILNVQGIFSQADDEA